MGIVTHQQPPTNDNMPVCYINEKGEAQHMFILPGF